MSEILRKCEVCQSLLDEEDLFCANCGAEATSRQQTSPRIELSGRLARTNFTCSACGASMSYDASAAALRCPFCGSVDMVSQPDAPTLAPHRVLPFQFDRDKAVSILRSWLGQGFWRPSDLAQQASIVTMVPVYVPYWVFHAHTSTYWTADTGQTPVGAHGDWYPLSGEHQGHYSGLLIGASGALNPHETAAICPFDLAAGVPPDQVDLENVTVEQFSMQRKYARPLARQGLEQSESAAVSEQYVPSPARNVHVNVRIEALESEPVLLPVWILAYRYGQQVYRFLINGQTGQATGTAPTSWVKVLVAVVILAIVVLASLLCTGVLAPRISQAVPSHATRPAALTASDGCPHPFRPSAGSRLSGILTALVDNRSRQGTVGTDEPRTDPTAAEAVQRRRSRSAPTTDAGHGWTARGV